jgi:AcrR family transcriptional regulator/DNA-binding MarR family transcriptional regulator
MSVEAGVRRNTLRGGSRGGISSSPRVQVLEMQRARLLSAAAVTAAELGWAGTSVAHITARARVSRRTFYDLFANREECMIAVLDDVAERVRNELAGANLEDLPWRERIRTGLWVILCFFDREPVLARVCVLQSAAGGRRVLERRAEIIARLVAAVDTGRRESRRGAGIPSLTAEGLVGAAVSILYTRLLKDERGPLSGLLNELTSMIVFPYLGASAARREQARALPRVPRTKTGDESSRGAGVAHEDPLRDVPMRLTYRTARVLEAICHRPGASNRIVAEGAGIFDQGQVSKLLARLERLGLTVNTGRGQTRGEPNAWRLTAQGEEIERAVRAHPAGEESQRNNNRRNDNNRRSRR